MLSMCSCILTQGPQLEVLLLKVTKPLGQCLSTRGSQPLGWGVAEQPFYRDPISDNLHTIYLRYYS